MFHVPNVGMTLPLNLLFGLAYGGAEAVVDLLVDAIARFVPDEIRDRIDGGVEELVGLPEVGLELSIGLPFLEMESEQRIVKRRLPEIKEEARCFVELGDVSAGATRTISAPLLRCAAMLLTSCAASGPLERRRMRSASLIVLASMLSLA